MSDMYLSAIRSWLGERCELAALGTHDDSAVATARLAELVADFTHFRRADGPIWRSGAAAASATLAASGSVDAVVYVTENDPDPVASLPALLGELRLDTARALRVSGHECGNLGPALRCAAGELADGGAETVLVVVADHGTEHGRLMDNGLSVFSDGAAAFVVSTRRPASAHLELLGVDVARAPGAGDLLGSARAAKRSVSDVLQQCDVTVDDVSAIAFANYRWDAQRFLVAATRLPLDRVVRPDVVDVAHCFSADVPMALDHVLSTVGRPGAPADGAVLLGLVTGPWSWSSIAVRARTAI